MLNSNIIKRDQIEPYVFIGDELINVDHIVDKSVTIEQYNSITANIEGIRRLIKKLDNEALIWLTQNFLTYCRRDHFTTYDGTLKENIVPELLDRLKNKPSQD